ncbi:MAG: S1 RNA-binding domain-containing protein, partial [Syntrophales bacterium]
MVDDGNEILKQQAGDVAGEKEIIENADDFSGEKEESMDFKELYEQSLQSVQLGNVLIGKIVQINTDTVMVDVGWKTEGYIPAREISDENGNVVFNIGDEIEVLVDRRDQDGNLVLSRDKAAKIKIWDDVKIACEQNAPVKGTVLERVKGGL